MNDEQRKIVDQAAEAIRRANGAIEATLKPLSDLVDAMQKDHDSMKAPTDDRVIESTDEIMELAGNVEDLEGYVGKIAESANNLIHMTLSS